MHHLLSDLIKESLIMTEKSERGRRKKEKSPAGSLDLTITRRVFYRCATTAAQLDSNYGCFALQVVSVTSSANFDKKFIFRGNENPKHLDPIGSVIL